MFNRPLCYKEWQPWLKLTTKSVNSVKRCVSIRGTILDFCAQHRVPSFQLTYKFSDTTSTWTACRRQVTAGAQYFIGSIVARGAKGPYAAVGANASKALFSEQACRVVRAVVEAQLAVVRQARVPVATETVFARAVVRFARHVASGVRAAIVRVARRRVAAFAAVAVVAVAAVAPDAVDACSVPGAILPQALVQVGTVKSVADESVAARTKKSAVRVDAARKVSARRRHRPARITVRAVVAQAAFVEVGATRTISEVPRRASTFSDTWNVPALGADVACRGVLQAVDNAQSAVPRISVVALTRVASGRVNAV